MGWSKQDRVPGDFHTILAARTDVKPAPKPTSESAKTVHSDLPYCKVEERSKIIKKFREELISIWPSMCNLPIRIWFLELRHIDALVNSIGSGFHWLGCKADWRGYTVIDLSELACTSQLINHLSHSPLIIEQALLACGFAARWET